MGTASTDWDARAYHRISEPQFAWGLKVLEALPLAGDEVVLDAGCGSGRLTAELLGRLPRGRVVAVDTSPAMLEQARAVLEPKAQGRVRFVQADLAELRLDEPVDVVFSTATFHWVLDHDRLFHSLFCALKPGGRLFAQCGGEGNLRRLHARAHEAMARPELAPAFGGWREATYYADVASTRLRLASAGFVDVDVTLVPAPTPFADRRSFTEFVSKVNLRPYLARLPDAALAQRFLHEVVEPFAGDEPPWTLDYVRLNVRGRREQVR